MDKKEGIPHRCVGLTLGISAGGGRVGKLSSWHEAVSGKLRRCIRHKTLQMVAGVDAKGLCAGSLTRHHGMLVSLESALQATQRENLVNP